MVKPQESLSQAAMLCAMRHQYRYRGYESAEKARGALRRRMRGVAKQELDEAFAHATAMYAQAEEMVWANRDCLPPERFSEFEAQLLRQFPAVDLETVRSALGWAYYWRILR